MQRGIDYIGVGVGAVIFNNEGKIFLAQRGQGAKNERGKWEFPGGSVEFGDTLEETIIREVKEEHGIDIEITGLLHVCNHIIREEKQHWISPCFLCRLRSGVPQILEPTKCEKIGWFTIEEAKTLPLALSSKLNIEALEQKFKHSDRAET